jgi:hypothetical protein
MPPSPRYKFAINGGYKSTLRPAGKGLPSQHHDSTPPYTMSENSKPAGMALLIGALPTLLFLAMTLLLFVIQRTYPVGLQYCASVFSVVCGIACCAMLLRRMAVVGIMALLWNAFIAYIFFSGAAWTEFIKSAPHAIAS